MTRTLPGSPAGTTLSGITAARLLTTLTGPLVAGGVIARRKSVMPLLERRQTDADLVTTMTDLRERYGPGPLQLSLPGRRIVLPLVPDDVARVLAESPSPFTPANREKKAALSPFQPHGVLISTGPVRGHRRAFNEGVLDTDLTLHHLAGSIAPTVRDEMAGSARDGRITADDFIENWWRMVRRVVLGESARLDNSVTDDLWTLRKQGNWSYLQPNRRRTRDRFIGRLYDYCADADPLSLAGAVSATRAEPTVDPIGQIPHWLFAFDAAGMVTLRALAYWLHTLKQ